MNDHIHPTMRRALAGLFPVQTAHGVKVTGPCHVSGAHLSEAPNEPFTEEQLRALRLANHTNEALSAEETRCLLALDAEACAQFSEEALQRADCANNTDKAARAEGKKLFRALNDQIDAQVRAEVFNRNGGF